MKKYSGLLRWLVPAALVFAAGFVVAAFFDLQIDIAVHNTAALLPVLMECFGWYPAFLPPLILALMGALGKSMPWQWDRQKAKWWQGVLWGFLAVAGFAGVYYASFGYLEDRGMVFAPGDPLTFLWLVAGLLVAGVLAHWVWRMGPSRTLRIGFAAAWGSVYMVVNQVVIYLLKSVWARTRFDTMLAAGSFADFTPWYLPFGNGGSSFPSGHTANAAGVFVLLIFCDIYPAWGQRRKLVTGICWGYIALMAACRIVIGRHYLSDTLAAAAIMAGLFYALHHNEYYQKSLEDLHARLGRVKGGAEDAL